MIAAMSDQGFVNPLDRPIWHALTTRQAHLGLGRGRARRLDPDYGPFAAAAEDSAAALQDLGDLVRAHGSGLLLQAEEIALPPGTVAEMTAEGLQMVLEELAHVHCEAAIGLLGDDDAPEMIALAELTEPGPFASRTHRLGTFHGIRQDGRLSAMAGERMKLPGYTEISGVATHPDFRGRGYGAALTRAAAAHVVAHGEIPFLHVYATNTSAIALYERLGFAVRCPVNVALLVPA
jgi:predicted GNAT family acetyltransferase